MRLLALILLLAGLALGAAGMWGWLNEAPIFGLPHPRGSTTAFGSSTILLAASSFLFPRERQQPRNAAPTGEERKSRAVAGGVGVILVTGLAAFGDGSGFFDGTLVNTAPGLFVIFVTLGGAFALSRYVAEHGDEIGEARFDTRNKDEREP